MHGLSQLLPMMIILNPELLILAGTLWLENWMVSGLISSDYRKPVAYDIKFSYRDFKQKEEQVLLLH